MATIDKYNKQAWVNNSTKISAENLDKVETGLETLSEQTQQYVSEWADEWATFKSTELSQISSDISDNAANIETAFSAISNHYNRLEDLDAALVDLNTPVQTVSASINAKATTYTEANQTTHLDSVPTEDHFIRLDISLSGDAATGYDDLVNKIKSKKRIPLCSVNYESGSDAISPYFMGTGPGTFAIFNGTELWARLLAEQPGAAWENITSDEEATLLGNPIIALDNKLTFAVYNTKLNSTDPCHTFVTDNYDGDIDYMLIFYSANNNKYYFANLNDLSIGYDLRYWVESVPPANTTSEVRHSYLGVEQRHVNWEAFQLPTDDLRLQYVAFMTRTDHIEELGVSAYDYFYYLGDLYSASTYEQYPFVFRMQGDSTNFNYYEGFPLGFTGTYYLKVYGTYQSSNNKDFWFKIGNCYNGPYTDIGDPTADLNWSQYFSNPVITYKFTCPTGTSNAYKVLELCQKHTDDDIKQIAKNTLSDLISFGSDDPTTSTDGMFYFKINSTD